MRTTPVQLECRKCGKPFRTTVRQGKTRCPHCRAPRYVRKEQEWEGPVTSALKSASHRAEQIAARPPVWCECRCGYEWQSRAKDRATVRCPDCGTGVRIPHRTHANTGPSPHGRQAPAPMPRPGRPAPAPAPRRAAADRTPAPPSPLGGFLAALSGRQTAPAAVPVPEAPPVPAAPSPVAPRHVTPTRDEQRDLRRRESVCMVVSSLAGELRVWYDARPGTCEVQDTSLRREEQRCPAVPARAVTFWDGLKQDATAYACLQHAGPLAALADRSPYIEAQVTFLR